MKEHNQRMRKAYPAAYGRIEGDLRSLVTTNSTSR
jgi:hypothetical protein